MLEGNGAGRRGEIVCLAWWWASRSPTLLHSWPRRWGVGWGGRGGVGGLYFPPSRSQQSVNRPLHTLGLLSAAAPRAVGWYQAHSLKREGNKTKTHTLNSALQTGHYFLLVPPYFLMEQMRDHLSDKESCHFSRRWWSHTGARVGWTRASGERIRQRSHTQSPLMLYRRVFLLKWCLL